MKKAQITPFIIIGALILLSSSLFIYYRNFIVVEPEILPEDVVPIKTYIEACLKDTGKEAAIKAGMQGGYITLPNQVTLNRAYVELTPGSFIKIPYWSYNGISFIPSIDVMQNQLSDYIKDNIKKCVNLEVFERDYNLEEEDEIEVETIIAEKNLDIKMVYNIIVKNKATDEQTRISQFHTIVNVRLKKTYELAKQILEAENSQTYFEDMTIDWIAMNKDIPLNGLEFTCKANKWRVRDVRNELQDMIYYNVPKVRIRNTDYTGFLEDEEVYENLQKYTMEDIYQGGRPRQKAPEDAYDYSHYLLDVRTRPTDLRAGFLYSPTWGMDMTVRPSEGGIMRSTKQSASEQFLSFLCINTHHFTYDVTYPIEVMVRDDKSFNNQGYVFRFAFPVMINHNEPDKAGFINPLYVMAGGDFIGECEDLTGPTYDIRALGLDEYGISNMELKDVNISYNCFRFTCNLGTTKADQGAYRLRTQLPSSCANGFIKAEKPGYLEDQQQVLDSTDIDVDLRKLKTFRFEVVKNDYNYGNIGDDEIIEKPYSTIIELQSYDDPDLVFYRKYPLENNPSTIDLIEQNSKYKVDIMLFDEEDRIFIGGYKGNWSLDYRDIADNKRIVFHVINYLPKPLNKEQESEMIKFLEEDNTYKQTLKPELE
ncbi:hypothetical protein CEE44_03595 [Candidatus Woesearchaeota archaeon B3_Woes]|nr:MAG: hypothetical protein CEE44_03595 [Candidatus Woesearchaeota archaeon B3_Woes]